MLKLKKGSKATVHKLSDLLRATETDQISNLEHGINRAQSSLNYQDSISSFLHGDVIGSSNGDQAVSSSGALQSLISAGVTLGTVALVL